MIAIKSAALNFFDILMIQGISDQAAVPVLAGGGSRGRDRKRRRRRHGSESRRSRGRLSGHNGAREKIALPGESIVKIPDNLDFDRAAGIIIIYGTALHALKIARARSRETLAVPAAGGTGLAACELGKLDGPEGDRPASSDEKLEFAKAHGAELTLNYAKEDLEGSD